MMRWKSDEGQRTKSQIGCLNRVCETKSGKGEKFAKVVVGEEDLKRRAEEGEGVEVSGALRAGCGAGQPD